MTLVTDQLLNFRLPLLDKKIKAMKKNMSSADKMVRLTIAAILVVLYLSNVVTGTLGIVSLVVAAIFALTSFISFCPLYTIFGISTCKVKD